MLTRVPNPRWRSHWILALAVLLAPAATLRAQSPLDSSAIATPQVSIVGDAVPQSISSLLEKGRSLESSGQWADALSHYEQSIRKHPHDTALEARFDIARLHYSLEQRYHDRSFRDSLGTLSSQQALSLYSDLLNKISVYYYTTPPWQELTRRGAQSLNIALTDDVFLAEHGIRASNEQLRSLRSELVNQTNRYAIRSQRDAASVATEISRLLASRIGLKQTVTLMEFSAAAAGGLDHYSAFLTADQLRDIYSQIDGNFVGLGVELKADDGALLIVDVIAHSPAERAGIQSADRIVAVDGRPTRELSTDEAATMLTGEEGSFVRVTTVTPGQEPRVLSIQRAHVEVPSLEDVQIIEKESGVAYLRIPAFQKTTARDLDAALWDLHRQGMRSLIIDLRGNPGGLLTASVEVADKFVASGPIVATRGRSERENFDYRAHRPGTWRVPLVVLIDGDSASASEIFAGAIKDSGRGVVVGSQSFGKGSVQGIFPLGYGGAGTRLTTAKFFSPDGHPISNIGISPDIDARRATAVAGETSATGSHLVGFRGGVDAEADSALKLAIEAARSQPVASL